MMRRLLVYSVLGSLLAHPVWMNAAPDVALPRTMLYDNKPIHPECLSFFGDSSRFDPVNLATCGHAAGTADGAGVLRSVSRGDESWQEYQPPSGRGYDRYRYLGTRGGLSYIQNEGNWGGSGNFSWVNAFERKGDVVSLKKDIAGGDRCNGGIISASLVNGNIRVTSRVTPRALLALDPDMKGYLASIDYGNLEDSALSCVGEARFINEKLSSIRIDPDAIESPRRGDKTYMGCMSSELMNAKQAKALTLDPEALAMLIVHMKVCAGERM